MQTCAIWQIYAHSVAKIAKNQKNLLIRSGDSCLSCWPKITRPMKAVCGFRCLIRNNNNKKINDAYNNNTNYNN